MAEEAYNWDDDARRASDAVVQVGKDYPALAPHLNAAVVSYGKPSGPDDDRQLEFYPPWGRDNPTPGKVHIELFNRDLKGRDLQETIAGDMLHHLGNIDPMTGKPVDPEFFAMKKELGGARGTLDQKRDLDAYQRDLGNKSYETAPYGQWDQSSRLDAYVRAGVFPAQNPEWTDVQQNPRMQPIFNKMRSYLRASP